MSYFESNKVKQIAALGGIVILGGFLLFALSDFIPAFLGAVIFYIICSPFVHFLITKGKFKKGLAVSTALILSFLVILIPVFFLTYMLISKLSAMAGSYDMYAELQQLTDYINTKYGVNILAQDNIIKLQTEAANIIPNLLEQTMSILGTIAIMYFILFYMLYSETHVEKSITRFLPYTKGNAELFAKELVSQTYSNVIGAPLLALIQSCFAIFGFWLFGLNEPVFWGIMCGFLSFIPLVGSALVWVPAGLIQLTAGPSWQGIAILAYGAIVIINVDNVFRFVLQKRIGDIHPMVTVFGVIFGLQWFSITGIIFGPLLISYLLIMIKLYRVEYGGKNFITPDSMPNHDITVEDQNKSDTEKS